MYLAGSSLTLLFFVLVVVFVAADVVLAVVVIGSKQRFQRSGLAVASRLCWNEGKVCPRGAMELPFPPRLLGCFKEGMVPVWMHQRASYVSQVVQI